MRKSFLAAGLIGALASPAVAADTPAAYPRDLTQADFERAMTELSNWGRWGADDQTGTVNLITPEKRKAAAALVRDGVSVSMSLDADLPQPGSTKRATWQHVMFANGLGRREGFVVDSYTVFFHGSSTTHMDALSHYIHQGHIYNGFPGSGTTTWGATKNDILPFKNGILTRGILVDLPLLQGVPYLADDAAIYPEDLEAWEKKAGIHIGSGDAVFIRTGRWARDAAHPSPDAKGHIAGLYGSCAKLLRQRDIAILGSDGIQDVRPSRIEGVDQPIHQLLLVAMGTPLFDNCYLEDLSAAARQRGRWEFLFTAAPLRVPGGTGSPLNPIATF